MRYFAIVVTLIGCTSSQGPVTDRTDCISCHVKPLVTDPPPAVCAVKDHATYAETCSDCHGTTAWCPADGMHTQWNITSSSHAGWDCADCHLAITYDPPSVTDPKQISCTNCHWHDQARVDPFHIGKSDYRYGPATCLDSECHGGGRRQ